jgi:hypothetical protein
MIINLTQHTASQEQIDAGVVDLPTDSAALVRATLTFDELPSQETIWARARLLADIAASAPCPPGEPRAAMIGGAPYLMAALEDTLRRAGVQPMYAFSTRESIEQAQPDGSVRKINVFRHLGFVEV